MLCLSFCWGFFNLLRKLFSVDSLSFQNVADFDNVIVISHNSLAVAPKQTPP